MHCHFLSHFQNVGKDPFPSMNLKASTSPALSINSHFGPFVGEFIRETFQSYSLHNAEMAVFSLELCKAGIRCSCSAWCASSNTLCTVKTRKPRFVSLKLEKFWECFLNYTSCETTCLKTNN